MNNKHQGALLAIFIPIFLFFFPVIISGVHYRDDLERSFSGGYGWTELGRPFADWMMKFISLSDDLLVDTTPFPAMLSIIILVASVYIYWKKVDKSECIWIAVALSAIVINPFFIQNILFKFDVLPMSMAMAFAIIASAVDVTNKKSIIISIILLILSLSLYQSCTNIFIGLISISALFKINNSNETIKDITKKLIIFFIGYLIYFSLTKIFISDLSSRSEIVTIDYNGFLSIIKNMNDFIFFALSFINKTIFIILLIPTMCFLFLLFKIEKRNIKISILNKILIVLLLISSIFGPLLILKTPALMPRTLSGFGAIMAAISISSILLINNTISKLLVIISLIVPISLSYSSNRAIEEQRKFENSIFYSIKDDLKLFDENKRVYFSGKVPLSQRSKIASNNNRLVSYMISPASEWLATIQLKAIGQKNVSHGYGEESKNKNIISNYISNSGKPIIIRDMYCIYDINNNIYVDFK